MLLFYTLLSYVKQKSGFCKQAETKTVAPTSVEIMIVVAIIGVVAAIALPDTTRQFN
jgi:Tfp pilus assembly protein FimT